MSSPPLHVVGCCRYGTLRVLDVGIQSIVAHCRTSVSTNLHALRFIGELAEWRSWTPELPATELEGIDGSRDALAMTDEIPSFVNPRSKTDAARQLQHRSIHLPAGSRLPFGHSPPRHLAAHLRLYKLLTGPG